MKQKFIDGFIAAFFVMGLVLFYNKATENRKEKEAKGEQVNKYFGFSAAQGIAIIVAVVIMGAIMDAKRETGYDEGWEDRHIYGSQSPEVE